MNDNILGMDEDNETLNWRSENWVYVLCLFMSPIEAEICPGMI